jgi:hypothetical protein
MGHRYRQPVCSVQACGFSPLACQTESVTGSYNLTIG